ncbi:MAG: DUF438 domain-containing protein [Lachnospiraceae bacterium]|nr:DUF438 domain-containing protein [Lachnospiraceae bacterium]
MSEYINNAEIRQNAIKEILKQLHEGKSVDEVKSQFENAFHGVSASEISAAEAALISEGLPVDEVQRLCDVHAAVFKGSIEEIHQPSDPKLIPGHPLNILFLENRRIEEIMYDSIRPFLEANDILGSRDKLLEGLKLLSGVSNHYKKKENLFFPYMEKYGITAPPKVMWGVDDEIREQIKEISSLVTNDKLEIPSVIEAIDEMMTKVSEMIFKEENIMIPMLLEHLKDEDWKIISEGMPEIGYIIEKTPVWNGNSQNEKVAEIKSEAVTNESFGVVKVPSGEFKIEELTAMLNALPMDITFVDQNDEVKYFSEGKERAFPRTRSIIGRNVSNCHPPASVHIVEKIVDDFKQGKKDHEDFWIKMGDKYILIRYFAVRSESGEYLGVLEVTQDIRPIQEITGEKRLMS